MKEIRFSIKDKHESKLYKLITDISEDLRDNKGYSEEEIKGFLIGNPELFTSTPVIFCAKIGITNRTINIHNSKKSFFV